MRLSDFDYYLPKKLIAQKQISPRDNSRLMVIDGEIEHRHFYNIIEYLNKGDVLVLNQTKVVNCRLKGKKTTGTKAELIISETRGNRCKCMIRAKRTRIGNKLLFGKYKAEIIGQEGEEFIVRFNENVNKILQKTGSLPTPPYIKRKVKESQYQTIYSAKKGSMAAPTAGLHFTKKLLDKIRKKGVKIAKITLHIDFGTFLPVTDIKKHKMHVEYFEIDKKDADIINNRKARLFVVGTTSVRTLESAADKNGKIRAKRGKTNLFIRPGYRFKTKIDALITNFHFPKSTLLMLVSAFIGRKKILNAYKIAVRKRYRFFSLGDSMLIKKFK